MTDDTLNLILTLLALSSALNLVLTLRLLTSLRVTTGAGERPFALPEGEVVPAVTGRRLLGGQPRPITHGGQPAVLLFLSSRCPKCRDKLPEIAALLPALAEAGLTLWLVSRESRWRLRRFLAQSGLAPHAVRVRLDALRSLNPTLASPYYLFLNEKAELQAAGLIGDENWQSFGAQMDELGQALEAIA